MAYQMKSERRSRAALMRALRREHAKAVRSAASQFVYSGTAYNHVAQEFKAINDRIVDVYLNGTGVSS